MVFNLSKKIGERARIAAAALTCFALTSAAAFAEAPKIYFQPMPVVAGENAQLVLSASDEAPSLRELPKIPGLRWLNGGQPQTSVQIVNGDATRSSIYFFMVAKAGTVQIPELNVVVGNQTYRSQPQKLQVAAGALSDLRKYLFIQPQYRINRSEVYVGEEVPMEIVLYKAKGMNAAPAAYPELSLENVVFDDFKRYYRRPEQCVDNRFAPYPYQMLDRRVDGTDYEVSSFLTAFRPLVAGQVSGDIVLKCKVVAPRSHARRRSRSPFDDMFGGGFFDDPFGRGSAEIREITAKVPSITVKPLPPPLADAPFLGVIGDWTISVSVSADTLRAGTPFTLSVDLKGRGSLENLKAPEAAIPGFNAYSPEVARGQGGDPVAGLADNASIKYTLIPTRPGKTNIDFAVSVFQSGEGRYKIAKLNRTVEVLPSPNGQSFAWAAPKDHGDKGPVIAENAPKTTDILYLKKRPSGAVSLPLWTNYAPAIGLMALLGPLFWAGVELSRRRRERLSNDPLSRRRFEAKRRAGQVLSAVRGASPETLPEVARSTVVTYVSDLKGFPPGVTVGELERRLEGSELAQCLKEAEALSYMPGTISKSHDLRDRLVRALKKLSVVAIVCAAALTASSVSAADKAVAAATTDDAVNAMLSAYDDGDFARAKRLIAARIHPAAPDPAWLYNLGDCCYQEGDLARALMYFERASRLAPRDSDIAENLNHVRRQLALPELYQARDPFEVARQVRDLLRPDEWALLAAAAWLAAWLALAARRFTSSRAWVIALCFAGLVFLLATVAAVSQKVSRYNDRDAIILERNVRVYVLPSVKASKAKFTLTAGEEVQIEETRAGWVRVRSGKAEGWVRADAVGRLWEG